LPVNLKTGTQKCDRCQYVALANKIARMACAITVRGERYKELKLLLAAADRSATPIGEGTTT
jgi:hypothetical protein